MLKDVERAWLMQTMEVNAVAPLMLTKALEPFLKLPRKAPRRQQGQSQGGSAATTIERAPSVVASVSARVGSISDNGLGGWYSYRLSKVRLNKQKRKNTNAGFISFLFV
jgi:hypothetical protein